jgi:hypothetical protein
MMKRGFVVALLATLLLVTMVAPASATKPDRSTNLVDGHKITICHATRSLSNPYVEITIDEAAWNDQTDDKKHGDHHTRTKNGEMWSDYILKDGQECTLDRDEPLLCEGEEVDFIVEFSGAKLVSTEHPRLTQLTETVYGLDIPAGTYSLIMGSSDFGKRAADKPQANEQWRALFNGVYASGYSEDLTPEDVAPVSNVSYPKDAVRFQEDVTFVTAEHWDEVNDSLTPDSVVPDFVCGIAVGASG